MNLHEAKALGLRYKTRKRVGRGSGSGHGKTSARGHKGAKARSGWSMRIGWEGGQMPLFRRLPKRGFNNKNFRKVYTIINVGDLEASFEAGATVDLGAVIAKGLTSQEKHSDLFKVLGNGALTKKFTVRAHAVTESARAKIEGAGGAVEIIPGVQYRPKFTARGASAPRKPGARTPDKV
ncbi:MAG: 50S ribosomal protein L15 [Planctomycetota bacterium]